MVNLQNDSCSCGDAVTVDIDRYEKTTSGTNRNDFKKFLTVCGFTFLILLIILAFVLGIVYMVNGKQKPPTEKPPPAPEKPQNPSDGEKPQPPNQPPKPPTKVPTPVPSPDSGCHSGSGCKGKGTDV